MRLKRSFNVFKQVLRREYVKLLSIFGKDIDYIYNDVFATGPLRNKKGTKDFCMLIIKEFNPKSVIDFGCGTGDILAPFEDKNIEVLGLDGSKANMAHKQIHNFQIFDLRKKYSSEKKYDLCLCLEVAEHIDENHSHTLIDNLVNSSDKIIFTAAPPGQIDLNHFNLKPKEYWINDFKKRGFELDKKAVANMKKRIINFFPKWYANNLMIFRKVK